MRYKFAFPAPAKVELYRREKKCHRQDALLSSGIKLKQQIQPDARLSYNEDIDDA